MFALVAICFTILFYRAAAHERMTAWVWAISSLALTMIVIWLTQRIGVVLLAQVGLYVAMWWYNMRRHDKARRENNTITR